MKPLKRLGWLGIVLLALGLWAQAEEPAANSSPYQTIVDRNAFNLKPPPSLTPEKTEPPPPPLAKVVLTGVTSMFSKKRALLEIEEQEPGKQKNKKSTILQEGEREGSVEIISIDVEQATVKIKNNGFETNLIFEVQKASAPPAPPPGGPGRPVVGIPGYNPAAANPGGFPGIVSQPQGIPLPGGTPPNAGPTIIGRESSVKPNPYGVYGGSVPGATGVGLTPSGTTPTTPTLPTRYYRVTPPMPK